MFVISLGTPGRQYTTVPFPAVSLTPGAVPTSLVSGVAPSGIMAIFFLAGVSSNSLPTLSVCSLISLTASLYRTKPSLIFSCAVVMS
jgi:hypothetical protein